MLAQHPIPEWMLSCSFLTLLPFVSAFRDDLLLIGPGNRNYTYMAQAVNKGVTVVGLWDQRHPGMADYIPVAVEHAIEPDTKLIFVGDVICFSTQLVNQHGGYMSP
jgi:nuclear pore complex protein Nup210